jgi:uncharacterized protein Veg
MIRTRFEKIREKFANGVGEPIRVLVDPDMNISRRHAQNHHGVIVDAGSSYVRVKMEATGTIYRMSYQWVYLVTDDGEIIEEDVLDRLGQALHDGDVVAVAHEKTLEITKIDLVLASGKLEVLLRGTKRTVQSRHCLRLPVDETLLMAAALNDFQPLVVED